MTPRLVRFPIANYRVCRRRRLRMLSRPLPCEGRWLPVVDVPTFETALVYPLRPTQGPIGVRGVNDAAMVSIPENFGGIPEMSFLKNSCIKSLIS